MSNAALERKLLRDAWLARSQIAAIALVIAAGIASFLMLRGACSSLTRARDVYYASQRFAHVFATLERAPESLARHIERTPGVAVVQTRITKDVSLPLEGLWPPANGRILSLPAHGESATNAIVLVAGRLPARGRTDEVVVLESFAEAHGLSPGHHLPAVINGRLERLRVVGIAHSPETVFAIRPGALADNPRGFGVLWMERSALAAAFDLEGAFNEISLRLSPGASEAAVLAAVDRRLEPYGGHGAIARRDQLSDKILSGELGTLTTLSAMVPLVFLAVTVFLIRLVLGRLITLQRPEIATLKAIGYSDREVGQHYAGLCVLVLVPGAALGLLAGYGLGHVILGMYARSFRLPQLELQLSASLVGTALGMSLLGAASGALLAVRAAVRLPPAEAMRPASPARYRRGLLERAGLSWWLGPSAMMVAREVLRRPLKTSMSALGIAGATSLLVLGRFGWDSMQSYFAGTFQSEHRQDLTVTFERPVEPRVVTELSRRPGVLRAEGVRSVPARIERGHRSRESMLLGLPADGTLRQVADQTGRAVPLPASGAVASRKLCEVLGIAVGDRVRVTLREGERKTITPLVVGVVDDSAGLPLYLRADELAALVGDSGAVSSALLSVEPWAVRELERFLSRSPLVLDVSELETDMQRVYDQNRRPFDVWTWVSTLLASSVIFGVVYNNARISLTARSRELASLRVLGLSRREIARILLGTLAAEVLLALPLGLLLGRGFTDLFAAAMDQETFRWIVVVSSRTYAFAAGVTLLAAALSASWVRRNLERLDLVAVLKTRE